MGGGKEIQIVVRRKPRLVIFQRLKPYTTKFPTLGQEYMRKLFKKYVKESKNYTHEEIAKMIGGKVIVLPSGRKVIQCPDGKILPKASAYARYMIKNREAPIKRKKVSKWMKYLADEYTRTIITNYKLLQLRKALLKLKSI